MVINSKEYWEERFKNGSWIFMAGRNQSIYFMRLLLNNLLYDIYIDILNNCLSTLDEGCAVGDGTFCLSRAFPTSQVQGYDFSSEAIMQAKLFYTNINFTDKLNPDDKFDVVCCSNLLEHFKNPMYQIVTRLEMVNKYYIILVPYKDNLKCPEHFSSFDENSFPDKLNDFTKIQSTIIKDIQKQYWDGYQLLVVYKKGFKGLIF
jgi:trans-aconitate methyltransferase